MPVLEAARSNVAPKQSMAEKVAVWLSIVETIMRESWAARVSLMLLRFWLKAAGKTPRIATKAKATTPRAITTSISENPRVLFFLTRRIRVDIFGPPGQQRDRDLVKFPGCFLLIVGIGGPAAGIHESGKEFNEEGVGCGRQGNHPAGIELDEGQRDRRRTDASGQVNLIAGIFGGHQAIGRRIGTGQKRNTRREEVPFADGNRDKVLVLKNDVGL